MALAVALAVCFAVAPDAQAGLWEDARTVVPLLPPTSPVPLSGGSSGDLANCGGTATFHTTSIDRRSCSVSFSAQPGNLEIGIRGSSFTGTITMRLVDSNGTYAEKSCNYFLGGKQQIGQFQFGSGCGATRYTNATISNSLTPLPMRAGALTLLGWVSGSAPEPTGPWEVYARGA